jgi:hypothetical protein
MNRKSRGFGKIVCFSICIIVLVSLAWMSCSVKHKEQSTPQPIIKSVSISPPTIQKNQEGVVDVEVVDDAGRPMSGIRVSFSVVPANIGYCTPAVDTTDANGSAGSIFFATNAGTATIQATSEGVPAKTVQVEVVPSGSATKPFSIEIVPPLLPADGISASQVKVIVSDTTGNLAPDSTVVKFTAGEEFEDVDGDGYFAEGVDKLKYDTNQDSRWNPIGFIPSYAYTQDGEVTVTYVAGFRTGTAYIKVTSSVNDYLIQENASILLVPTDSVAYIVLLPDLPTIQVRGTGGVEATQVRAILYDHNGNRAGADFPVEFYIINGPQGGESINGEVSEYITINTNSSGEAVVNLVSGTKSGVIKLRAKSGGVLSSSCIVTVCAGPPAELSLSPYHCNIRGWDITCVEDTICACVVDIYGNPVPDSTSVHFETEEGSVRCCDKTKQGCAYSLYISGDPRNDGRALIWAYTWGPDGMIADTSELIVSGLPATVTFLTYPQTLPADGVSQGHVAIEVLDSNSNFMVKGTPVDMNSFFGSIASGSINDGCYGSLFETEMKSEVLSEDYSMKYPDHDDSIGVVTSLTATAGIVSTSVIVTFLTGNTFTDNCDISVITIPVGATVPVTLHVKDAYGNPLGGHHIVADQTHSWRGTISGSAYTDEFGEATGFFFTGQSIGTGIIAFQDQDPKGGIILAFNVSIIP